jgi:uncharacterized RDD family membrane protein YckC
MAIIQINTAFNIDLEFEVAAFHRRLFAYIIDFIILVIYLSSMKYLLYAGFDISIRDNMGLDIIVISLPMLLYSLVTEVLMNGQTIGKKLMRIRVISLDGGEPTLGQFILRWITKFFEWPFLFGYVVFYSAAIYAYAIITGFLGIGVVIMLVVSKKSQRLGDIAAGTVVVDTRSDMSVEDTVFMNIEQPGYQVMFPQVMRLSDNDINTIKTVCTHLEKYRNTDAGIRVEQKVKDVLKIDSELPTPTFLKKLLEDYNYLATKE